MLVNFQSMNPKVQFVYRKQGTLWALCMTNVYVRFVLYQVIDIDGVMDCLNQLLEGITNRLVELKSYSFDVTQPER